LKTTKKIKIIGPIGDFGGRDVEVNIIAKALENNYRVRIFSTGYMTEKSFSLLNLRNTTWQSIYKELHSQNIILRQLSRLSKFINKGSRETYGYVINRFSKRLISFDRLQWEIIENELKNADVVLLCVQLTTKFLPEIVQFCHENKIPCLVRTTGTIQNVPEKDFDFLKKVTLFIHHSESNASHLNEQINLPYVVIDQCALFEKQLLDLPIQAKKPYRFGYLGRLSAEKGILPVARFFAQNDYPFVVAGDGSQKETLLATIANSSQCTYLGLLQNHELATFFERIDVLIIPSYEESGPLVGLEAMAAGKIIISTKVGAMEDRLEGLHSFWFQIENLTSLQLVITKILNLHESDRLLISESVRQRYLCQYSFQAISEKYKELIKEN